MRTEITIDGANALGANYIAWAPVHATIRVAEADGQDGSIATQLSNQNPAQGGQVVFYSAIAAGVVGQDQIQLSLPADGTPVDFFIGGKFGSPSKDDQDAVIQSTEASSGAVLSTKSLMVRIRKNANTLSTQERDRFISAFATLNNAGNGKFGDFRNMHTDVSSPEAHGDFGFLPWHRAYLLDLERELQNIDPSVALPYWKFDEPAPNLFGTAFIGVPSSSGSLQFDPANPLRFWATDQTPGILRTPLFDTNASPASFPSGSGLQPVLSETDTLALGTAFANFTGMEGDPHGNAHVSFTGYIQSIGTAAKDPLFFLLHANVDRLWAKWQWVNGRFDGTAPDSYTAQGSAGDPGSVRIGHNLNDTMWPWNQDTNAPRPPTAPGGNFPPSPGANAPGLTPKVGDLIDFQGVINAAQLLGFGYDDVGFQL